MSDNGYELEPLLISLPQAAGRLGIHRTTLYKMCLAGAGPKWIWVGSKMMIPRDDFRRWISSASRTGAGRRVIGADL
jgi:excisionase family DNA binding protein